MLTEGGKVYTYNARNQLTSYTENGRTTTYDYWIDGLRRSKTLANGDEEEYLWDGNNLVYVNPSMSECLLTGFTAYYGLGLFESNQNGTKYRYQRNAHGDTTALLNQSGDIVRCYTYEDAFGTSTYSADDTNPFLYAGQYYDRESQSYYLRARYYLPRYGRFTAEDPARDGLNWYTYCADNPVRYYDPSGKIVIEAALGEFLLELVICAVAAACGLAVTDYGNNSNSGMYSNSLSLFEGTISPSDFDVFSRKPLEGSPIQSGRFGTLTQPSGQFDFFVNEHPMQNDAQQSEILPIQDQDKKTNVTTKKSIPIPAGLKNGSRIRMPQDFTDEWRKERHSDTYTHKETGWKIKKDYSKHGGEHWGLSPRKGSGHLNVDRNGRIFGGSKWK